MTQIEKLETAVASIQKQINKIANLKGVSAEQAEQARDFIISECYKIGATDPVFKVEEDYR